MKITLPDKGEKSTVDMDIDDVDFLKRKSNFIPEIGTSIGKLTEASIFKSLHSNLKSTTESPRQVAVSCIEGAMHEWFAHGREIYEARQSAMRNVCKDANLPVPAVEMSFDDRASLWLDKYT